MFLVLFLLCIFNLGFACYVFTKIKEFDDDTECLYDLVTELNEVILKKGLNERKC